MITEEQAGFRRGYSTLDNIFTLHGIVERYLGSKKKVYAAFIDFCKAFDSISRDSLFAILEKNGLNGKMLKVLKSVYQYTPSCVRCPEGYTDYFECTSGVKQGCKCSPILFSFVVGEVSNEITRRGKHGIQLLPNDTTIYLLLFADDVVLLSDTPTGLQNQLNSLERASESVGLKVNMTKSKAMVFRLGGRLAAHEQWHIGGKKLEVVNQYNYLGYKFSTKLSYNTAMSNLSMKGKAAVVQTMRPLKRLMCTSPSVFFKVFDTQIQPIVLYGAEIWGLSKCDEIERVHLLMIKRFLSVARRTPNVMVYYDTGRYPLYIWATQRVVKYWLRILRMEDTRFPKKVYRRMIDSCIPNCWSNRIRDVLFEYDFQDVWRGQRVQNETTFLKELKRRMMCRFDENWNLRLLMSERYTVYRMFKHDHNRERYLYDLDKPVFRDLYIRFRLGMSELHVHRYRYNEPPSLICPSCNESEEDEFHFLFKCPAYENIRVKYLRFCFGLTVQESLVACFSTNEKEKVRAVASYLYHAFQQRTTCLM